MGSTWVLDYTLSAGLGLVANTDSDGTSGLFGLTGEVVGNEVELFATTYGLSDLDPTYLYGITDLLSATTLPKSESFTRLATAPVDSTFKGVAFAPAPVPEPNAWALMLAGVGLTGAALRRRRAQPGLDVRA